MEMVQKRFESGIIEQLCMKVCTVQLSCSRQLYCSISADFYSSFDVSQNPSKFCIYSCPEQLSYYNNYGYYLGLSKVNQRINAFLNSHATVSFAVICSVLHRYAGRAESCALSFRPSENPGSIWCREFKNRVVDLEFPSFQTHLLNPSMIALLMKFYVATAAWLNQLAVAGDDYGDMREFKEFQMPLPSEVQCTVFCVL